MTFESDWNSYNPAPLVHMRGDEEKPLSLSEIIWKERFITQTAILGLAVFSKIALHWYGEPNGTEICGNSD